MNPDTLMTDLKWLARMHQRMGSLQNNEQAAMFQLELALADGKMVEILECAPITRAEMEYQVLNVGRADMVLFHVDGGMTIIEAKVAGADREMVAGIGQLFMYQAALERTHKPKYINRVLAVPVLAECSMPTWEACRVAGVRMFHLMWWGMLSATLKAMDTRGVPSGPQVEAV